MAKNKSSVGRYSKVFRLVGVLEKCNGKTSVGDSGALISPKALKVLAAIGVVILTGGLLVGFYFLAPVIAPVIPLQSLIRTLMLIIMLLSFVLGIKNIVTVLYTADDLPVLLPMPFSAGQIVTAKLAVSSRFPVILSLVVVNAACLGSGIRLGADASFFIGTLLSSVLIPVTALAAVTLLVVLIFRVFGFIRNRDITMVLGGVFTLGLTVAYMFVTNKLNGSESGRAATALVSGLSAVSSGFPNISFMTRFMFEGDIAGLLISVGVTAAFIAAAMLAVKLFYLSTALSMQTTGSKKKSVTRGSLSSEKKSALKSLTKYESRSARRNPAYMIYGFGMSFLWPLFVVLPMIMGNNSFLTKVTLPLDFWSALIAALTVGVAASCFSCGMNVLAVSAFSREGDTFSALKAMPIDPGDYYRSKRNFAVLICSLGSITYVLILGVISVVAGAVPLQSCWIFLLAAVICFLMNITIVNFMLLKNSKKPYFTWDTETEISRKLTWVNILVIVVAFVMDILFFVVIALSSFLSSPEGGAYSGTVTTVAVISAVVLGVGVPITAFITNRYCMKKACDNLAAL